jgi:hypothetical protein
MNLNELHVQMIWLDVVVHYADETMEHWTNIPQHDGISAPWSTLTHDPQADFAQLYAMMKANGSKKPQKTLSQAEFPDHFSREFRRSMEWRSQIR